jgi:GNAT superfamily N-acetyltransferase
MIRAATAADVSKLVALIEELAEYERARSEVEIDETMLATALFGKEPSLYARVAIDDEGEVIGMAMYFRSFSTWTGHPGIYLEDLYVRPEHRGKGVGKALLIALAKLAVETGCRRLEWSVLDWNEPAIAFYRSIGGRFQAVSATSSLSFSTGLRNPRVFRGRSFKLS